LPLTKPSLPVFILADDKPAANINNITIYASRFIIEEKNFVKFFPKNQLIKGYREATVLIYSNGFKLYNFLRDFLKHNQQYPDTGIKNDHYISYSLPVIMQ